MGGHAGYGLMTMWSCNMRGRDCERACHVLCVLCKCICLRGRALIYSLSLKRTRPSLKTFLK